MKFHATSQETFLLWRWEHMSPAKPSRWWRVACFTEIGTAIIYTCLTFLLDFWSNWTAYLTVLWNVTWLTESTTGHHNSRLRRAKWLGRCQHSYIWLSTNLNRGHRFPKRHWVYYQLQCTYISNSLAYHSRFCVCVCVCVCVRAHALNIQWIEAQARWYVLSIKV